jgi:hypothetical protein
LCFYLHGRDGGRGREGERERKRKREDDNMHSVSSAKFMW